jgi:glycosyltransferase involved in cell wall biosynthesis
MSAKKDNTGKKKGGKAHKKARGKGEKRGKPGLPSVSVIIPTLNEEESLGETLDEIPRDFTDKLEIMIVDGLSTDRTVEIAKEKGCRVVMEKRRGYGRAYKTGFGKARGDVIVTLDGDTTYPAGDIPRLVRMLVDEKLDFITCDRLSNLKSGVMNRTHRFGNWTLAKATNILFGMKIADSQTGMWVFRRSILKRLVLTSDGMPLSEEIKIEAFKDRKIRAREVAVDYRIRVGEIKLNTWGDGRKNLGFLFSKRFGKVRKERAAMARERGL